MSRTIKRYENRKMYDTEKGRYISLKGIAKLIRSGEDVKVIDNTSGEDLTAQTLTQIILEEGKDGNNPFSSRLLHEAIRFSNEVLDESVERVKDSVDDLLPHSLQRLFSGQRVNEMEELKNRVASLESILNDLHEKQSDRSESGKKNNQN